MIYCFVVLWESVCRSQCLITVCCGAFATQALQCLFLDEVNQQLSEKGLYIKSGKISIVDASVIKARRNRPNKGVNGENTQDPEAAYNVKAGADGKKKSTYDFKAHINVDVDGFIKSTDVTAGNVHDSRCFSDYQVAQKPKFMQIVLTRVKKQTNG